MLVTYCQAYLQLHPLFSSHLRLVCYFLYISPHGLITAAVSVWAHQILNFAVGLVLLAPSHKHSTPFPEKLHWLPISEHTKYKVACMWFSAIV